MTAQYEAQMAEVSRLIREAEDVRVDGIRSRTDYRVESDGERRAKVLRSEAETLMVATIALPGAPPHCPPYDPSNGTLVTFQPALEASDQQDGKPGHWKLFGVFDTVEERDAFIARFPKSAGIKASSLGAERSYPAVSAHGNLYADGVNKGVNETGLRRYRTIVRIAPELPWKTSYLNSYPTRAAFEAALEA